MQCLSAQLAAQKPRTLHLQDYKQCCDAPGTKVTVLQSCRGCVSPPCTPALHLQHPDLVPVLCSACQAETNSRQGGQRDRQRGQAAQVGKQGGPEEVGHSGARRGAVSPRVPGPRHQDAVRGRGGRPDARAGGGEAPLQVYVRPTLLTAMVLLLLGAVGCLAGQWCPLSTRSTASRC